MSIEKEDFFGHPNKASCLHDVFNNLTSEGKVVGFVWQAQGQCGFTVSRRKTNPDGAAAARWSAATLSIEDLQEIIRWVQHGANATVVTEVLNMDSQVTAQEWALKGAEKKSARESEGVIQRKKDAMLKEPSILTRLPHAEVSAAKDLVDSLMREENLLMDDIKRKLSASI